MALTHSAQAELRQYACDNLKRALPELIESYLGRTRSSTTVPCSLYDISLDLLQLLLISLHKFVAPKLHSDFLEKLRQEFPRDRVPLILAPFLYFCSPNKALAANSYSKTALAASGQIPDGRLIELPSTKVEIGVESVYDNLCDSIFTTQAKDNIMDTSWMNLILEIGYEFTSSIDECKNHLRCGSRELQAQDIAKIIGLMCRRHTSLLDCNVNLPTPANFWPGQQSVSVQGQPPKSQQQNAVNNNADGLVGSAAGAKVGDKTTEQTDKTDITTSDTTQTWKPDVFVQALKEVLPQLNWKDVCMGKCKLFVLEKSFDIFLKL